MEDLHIIVLIVLGILTIGFVYHLYDLSCGCDNSEHMKNISKSKNRPYIISRSGCGGCRRGGIEGFAAYDDNGEYYDTLLPWWNSTRHTRNMFWDIRGDVPITPYYVGPWLNSPLI